MRLPRRRTLLPLLAVVTVVVAAGLAAFQPWRLFTSTTVHEALPSVPSAPTTDASRPPLPSPSVHPTGPVTLAQGSFVSHEHRTSGQARVLGLPDGSRVLRLEQLDTSDGPALHVWLSDQSVRADRSGWHVFDDGAYVDLGDLKGNVGDQNYAIPAGTALDRLTSVSIWCARFHVSFGAAMLRPAV